MKKILIFACVLAVAAGCASGMQKRFTVVVDPPDARITVVPGGGQAVQKYRSPADITVSLPQGAGETAQGKLVVERETYKPVTIPLNSIHAETLKLRLERAFRYRLKFRMTGPALSDELAYRDKLLAVRLMPGEREFQAKIENLAQTPLSIVWAKSDYTDPGNRTHRIVPSHVRPQDRLKTVPPQMIPAGGSVTARFISADSISYSQGKRSYESEPLFLLDDDSALALKGKSFSVFLPIEQDGAIIPDYNFRIEIVDVIRE